MEYIWHHCEVLSSNLSYEFCTLVAVVDIVNFVSVYRFEDKLYASLLCIVSKIPSHVQEEILTKLRVSAIDHAPYSADIYKSTEL